MRLICGVSVKWAFPNVYGQAADFGHYVKREQEIEEKCTHSRFSPDQLLPIFAAYLDIIGVECVEKSQDILPSLC